VILARARGALVTAILTGAVVLAACGTSSSPTASASPSPSAAAAAASPDALPSPTSTPWPGNVAGAVIAIGAVDAQIAAAGQDMNAAITAKDLAHLRGAAEGLVTLLDETQRFIDTARAYPATKDMADAFTRAFSGMRDGAQEVADGVKNGDAQAINGGFTALGVGLNLYGLARTSLGPVLEQAIEQQKKYVK
jgi:hypothetical protein